MTAPTEPAVIAVRATIGGRYRLDMLNAETEERLGTMNTRPHDTWAMLEREIREREGMFCTLASAMHAPTTFIPHTSGDA
jgi:hypothetical protein